MRTRIARKIASGKSLARGRHQKVKKALARLGVPGAYLCGTWTNWPGEKPLRRLMVASEATRKAPIFNFTAAPGESWWVEPLA